MIFVKKENIIEESIIIDGQDHIHLTKVLRNRIGNEVLVCDEECTYLAIITDIDKKLTKCKIVTKTKIEQELKTKIYVYISATKGDKMELVTQKVTELGAYQVIPFVSKRSIIKFDDKSKEKKIERLNTVAKEAANQCKGTYLTTVPEILSFEEMVNHLVDKQLRVVLYESEQNMSFKQVISQSQFHSIAIIIGPEGGFEPEEIQKMQDVGCYVATLGKRILRAETAPIACVSIIQYEKDGLL